MFVGQSECVLPITIFECFSASFTDVIHNNLSPLRGLKRFDDSDPDPDWNHPLAVFSGRTENFPPLSCSFSRGARRQKPIRRQGGERSSEKESGQNLETCFIKHVGSHGSNSLNGKVTCTLYKFTLVRARGSGSTQSGETCAEEASQTSLMPVSNVIENSRERYLPAVDS